MPYLSKFVTYFFVILIDFQRVKYILNESNIDTFQGNFNITCNGDYFGSMWVCVSVCVCHYQTGVKQCGQWVCLSASSVFDKL